MIFCAEIGSNHKGIPALAYEMIRQAKMAGADIAKFQFRSDDRVRGMAMLYAEELKDWCDYWEIEFMASIFSMKALACARGIGQKRYKVAYSIADTKPHFITEMLEDGKEIFVSHGGYVHPLIRNLFCVPEYPHYPPVILPEKFGDKWYGYSSHVHGYADALVAIARGAKYVEKHVTLDKTEDSIKDNQFAISFQELADLVRLGKQIARFC